MKAFSLVLILMCLNTYATTFQVQSVPKQLKESDGLLQGYFLKSRPIKLDDGRIATQMIFKMTREQGLQSDFYGMDEIIVHYPGGTIAEETLEIQGVPKFNVGEHVVVFTKNVNNRYWGLNLGMGTYKIINYGQDKMLINTLFPNHPEMGQMKLEQFEKLVKEIKGGSLKQVVKADYPTETNTQTRAPAANNEAKTRTIASENEEVDNNTAGTSMQIFWLVTFLGILGAYFGRKNQKTTK